jgi:hypothetical protein
MKALTTVHVVLIETLVVERAEEGRLCCSRDGQLAVRRGTVQVCLVKQKRSEGPV